MQYASTSMELDGIVLSRIRGKGTESELSHMYKI